MEMGLHPFTRIMLEVLFKYVTINLGITYDSGKRRKKWI